MGASAFQPEFDRLDFLSLGHIQGGLGPGMEDSRVPHEPDPVTAPAIGLDQFAFPLQRGKVQRPLLPESTLRRDRLLGWLAEHSGRRLTYVVAEAGFGKTTLVADYTRRSRARTFWYRLDDGDTDGLVFLRYFIAACRAVDESLLGRAHALVSEASIEPLRQETVLEAALAELERLGEVPSVLVLDDFHTAEASASLREVVERLLARVPERLRVIVMARRTPELSVAALRAHGQVAELGAGALRFEESETRRLFAQSYPRDLDPAVIHELQTRTDGWPASIGLVRTAVEDRTPAQVRDFVHSLSGAEGSLYDYVAEEVVGELAPELRQFLLRVVLLEEIDIENAALAAGVAQADARRMIAEAQRLCLLSRGDTLIGAWRAHPLVRDFLASHLEAEVGPEGVAAIHRHLAALLEPTSWRLAARHWAAAGDADEVRRVIRAAVPAIIGTGDLTAAADLISRFPDPAPNPWFDIIRSRQSAAEVRYDDALAWARHAEEAIAELAVSDPLLATSSALNLLFVGIVARDPTVRAEAFSKLNPCEDPELTAIVRSARMVFGAEGSGRLDELAQELRATARLNRERGHGRYEGVTLLNLAECQIASGHLRDALEHALLAVRCLEAYGDSGDVAAAHATAARALSILGCRREAADHARRVIEGPEARPEPNAVVEIAELEAMYGDPIAATRTLRELANSDPQVVNDPGYCVVMARLQMLGVGQQEQRLALPEGSPHAPPPGFRIGVVSLDLQARAHERSGDGGLAESMERALGQAQDQRAWFWWRNLRLTQALLSPSESLAGHISALGRKDAAHLSIQAELVLRRVDELDEHSYSVVRDEATLRPERWRWAIRKTIADPVTKAPQLRRCAELLEVVGSIEDVKTLRNLGRHKALKIPDAGRELSRRLAPRVLVEDLGRVRVWVGERAVAGTDMRRKVLALLTYLLARPQYSASREQVVEALWPDMAPEQGANSLNQTAYFLRRLFEPGGDDDTSAGYLNSRNDMIWLDQGLVTSRSGVCQKLIAKARRDPSPDVITELAEAYTGKFALDFMYEDWATAYRESLHAAYLDRIERALDLDTAAGAFDRAVRTAQLALEADPEADQIQARLIRLYRATGAHAAAAELYEQYASYMRDQLSVEPPPLEAM